MPPYNGSGTYTLTAGQPVVAGTDILDSTFNTLTADLATALSTCITRDGQSPPTTNLPMGSFKLTGLAAGTAAGHSVRFEQLQTGVNKLITVAGTADVITGTLTPTYLAYVAGDVFTFVVGSTNTTNVTINIDGLGAKAVTVNGSTALVAGALPSGKAVQIGYDGTRFQLLTNNYVGAATGTLPVANGGTGVTTSTGTGANVLGTSPTLTTPVINGFTGDTSVINIGSGQVYKDASGNVGIGTSSPAHKLHIVDTTYASLYIKSSTTNFAGMELENTNSATKWTFGVEGGAYNTAGILGIGIDGSGVKVAIDSSGNVGIGTAASVQKLTVWGTGTLPSSISNTQLLVGDTSGFANTGIALVTGAGNTSNITFGSTASPTLGRIDYDTPNNCMRFYTNSSERMRIASNGIVTMSAYGAGAATFSAAGVISSVSDETWKIKDGVPLDHDAMLKKLEPGYWFYNEEKAPTFGGDRQLGFYAQNVNAAIGPEAAPTPEEGKPWGYYDRSVLAVTVMSLQKALENIQEQQTLILALTARLETLEAK